MEAARGARVARYGGEGTRPHYRMSPLFYYLLPYPNLHCLISLAHVNDNYDINLHRALNSNENKYLSKCKILNPILHNTINLTYIYKYMLLIK